MADLALDPQNTALLIMDMENDQYGAVTSAGVAGDLLANNQRAAAAARAAGVQVIYVVVSFRPGYPEAHPRNKFQTHNKEVGRLREGEDGCKVIAELAPQEGDIVVTKRRVNAFFQTDLDLLLRSGDRTTLVLTGIATGGVILSTTRYASDADYELAILKDACADPDVERNECLFNHVLPMQATIASTNEFIAAIGQ
jgi:nicotinamidase-related amidase